MKIATALLLFAVRIALPAQEKLPPTFRLHFRMTETTVASPKASSTTGNYSMVLQGRARGKINASRRLPYTIPGKGEGRELHTVALGTIIECTASDSEGGVRIDCAFESSFVARDQPAGPVPAPVLPVMHSRQVTVSALVPLVQEVQVATLDDPATHSRIEIFVSADRFEGPLR